MFCTGHCSKSSDCGADQRCTRIVLNNNDTPADPFDDVVTGYCQSLFAPTMAESCASDGACAGSGADKCDTKYGLCYKAGAPSGAPCATEAQCELGAICRTQDDGFPGGYCQTFGCAAGAATGVDACPGAGSVCTQRSADDPLSACYEGCGQAGACTRGAENYVCKPPTSAAGAPGTICLYDKGV
jgi:hypothetical protein